MQFAQSSVNVIIGPMVASQLRVHLFGSMALFQDGGEDSPSSELIPMPSSAVARSLLAYLLFHRDMPHPRPVLLGAFWPDLPENRARRALTQALWHIRRALPDLVKSDPNTVAINPEVSLWVDVEEFFALARFQPPAAADLRLAIQLYRGDFLEGYYEDWVLLDRERLSATFLQLLEQLLNLEKSAGRYQEALDLALRLTRFDPLRESAHREVMRLHYALDRPEVALNQFETCRRILQEELALEPEQETVALAQEIGRRSVQPDLAYLPPATSAKTISLDYRSHDRPLVGREKERAKVLAQLDSSLNGLGGIVLLEGEAGIGKTRLLQELARDAEWRGAEVLWGHGRELEASVPYQPLIEALKSGLSPLRINQLAELVDEIWLQVLGPLLPALGMDLPPALDVSQERGRLAEALARFLTAWGQVKPLVIILEDLHWFDEDTLKVLASVAGRILQARVLVIASYRGGQIRPHSTLWEKLSALDSARVGVRLLLSPLDAVATGELVRHSLGLSQPPSIFALRLHQETEGNPLFVLETLQTLQDEGVLVQGENGKWSTPWDATTADYAELPLPPAVERTIARRLAQLADPMYQTLCLAAVLGAEFDFSLLRAARNQDPQALLENLGQLVKRRFLHETPQRYRFSHHKIRQVVYQEMEGKMRVHLHQQAAYALESIQANQAASLAYHFTHGELWEQAIQLHVLAGQQAAAVYATAAALEHFDLAISLLDKHQPFPEKQAAVLRFDALCLRRELRWIMGDAQGQQEDIAALCDLAESLGEPERLVEAWLQQAVFLSSVAGDYDAARQSAEAALDLAVSHGLASQASCARIQIGKLHRYLEQHEQAWQVLNTVLDDTKNTKPADTLSAYTSLIESYTWGGELELAQSYGDAMLAFATERGAKAGQARAHGLLGINAGLRADYDVAVSHFEAGLTLARQIGARHEEAEQIWYLAVYYDSVGDLGEAINLAEQYLAICRQIDNRPQLRAALDNLGNFYECVGQYDRAEELFYEALETVPSQAAVSFTAWAQLGLVHASICQQQLNQAASLLRDIKAAATTSQEPAVRADYFMHSGQLCVAKGQFDTARQQFNQAQKEYEALGALDYATMARSSAAFALYRMGRVAEAVELSQQAIDDFVASQSQNFALEIQWHHARIMQAAGDGEAFRAILEKAYHNLQARAESLKDPDWRHDYLTKVPVNRQILADWETMQAQTTLVYLPRANVPTGRPLRDDEYVQVAWTVEAPADRDIANKAARRRHIILDTLTKVSQICVGIVGEIRRR